MWIHEFTRILVAPLVSSNLLNQDEFEDTKGALRIRISKKNRQYNDQKKKYKWTNNDL